MTRRFWLFNFLLLTSVSLFATPQDTQPIPLVVARKYFAEARALCQTDGGQLWGVSLCGPMLFVDPSTRTVVANKADANGKLKADGEVFVGSLPKDQNIANTAVEWSGVRWTEMMWPLPDDERTRSTLIAHELFHRIQDQLAIPHSNGGDNAHLDELDGRYYMQLEWRALAWALAEKDDAKRRLFARDALLFRAERYRLFPEAPAQEQALELNEGLAEFTGVLVGNSTREMQISMALSDLSSHVQDKTFVRSFAYATGPAYGLLLERYAPGWRKQLDAGRGLSTLLQSALKFTVPAQLQQLAERQAQQYDGATLRATETEREKNRRELLAHYWALLVDGPVLTLHFKHMKVQFDPRNLQPLKDFGTVYPSMRISDDWGILEVSGGALMSPDWSSVTVPAPESVTGSSIKGNGWNLELTPDWKIVPGSRHGDLALRAGS